MCKLLSAIIFFSIINLLQIDLWAADIDKAPVVVENKSSDFVITQDDLVLYNKVKISKIFDIFKVNVNGLNLMRGFDEKGNCILVGFNEFNIENNTGTLGVAIVRGQEVWRSTSFETEKNGHNIIAIFSFKETKIQLVVAITNDESVVSFGYWAINPVSTKQTLML